MRRRRSLLVRLTRPAAALGLAAAVTVGLAQHTTTAAFTAQTGDTGNQVRTASTFCTSPGTDTVTVVRDTAVYEVNPNTNYATTAIGVGSGTAGDAYTLLKFTLPPTRTRCTVTAATLNVYARTPSTPATVQAFRASGSWDASLVWNTPTRPAPAGTGVGIPVSASAGWLQWPVTTLTRELYAGTDNGFLLKDSVDHSTTSRTQTWESRESDLTKAAYLEVTWG